MEHQSVLILLFFLLFPNLSTTLKWLWLYSHEPYDDGEEISCDHFSFINKQVKFCKNNPVFMESIRIAAGKSIQECQYQFRNNRWNCTIDVVPGSQASKQPIYNVGNVVRHGGYRVLTAGMRILMPARLGVNMNFSEQACASGNTRVEIGNPGQNFKRNQRNLQQQQHPHDKGREHEKKHKKQQSKFPFVAQGTKEAAFVHSLSSAGVAHQLTKSCSAGASPDCGCDKSLSDSKGGTFKWAGCSDNIDYGVSLSRTFVDALDHKMSRKNKTASLALVNLHNNEAGRKILQKLMRVECKCHGVSGSCEIKTCWRVMPNMRDIGEFLRRKFELAKMVEEKRIGSRRGLVGRPGSEFNDVDLVFLKDSPDFCNSNLKRGSLGTKGRVCREIMRPNKVSVPDSCDKLCCDRGHTTTRVKRIEMCRCKFQWCCNVTCSECVKEVEVSTCN